MEKIKVIAKEVGKPARPYEIENSYKAIKDFVGGNIETHDYPYFDEVTIYCNRDLQQTDVTIVLEEHQACLCGNCLIVKQDMESDGESVSFSGEEMRIMLDDVSKREICRKGLTREDVMQCFGNFTEMEM